ncbi:MAG: GcrA family cell cycle regulator [bacterium]|nr:GcrA family cell cycle regulator [bacterium]
MAYESSSLKGVVIPNTFKKTNEPDWEQWLPNHECTAGECLPQLVAKRHSSDQIALILRIDGFDVIAEQVVKETRRRGFRLLSKGAGLKPVRSRIEFPPEEVTAVSMSSEGEVNPASLELEPEGIIAKPGEKSCQWPIGDPGDKGFRYCPYKVEGRKPYCNLHETKAHQPVKKYRQPQRIGSARIQG